MIPRRLLFHLQIMSGELVSTMTADELRALQTPIKARYKSDPETARYVLSITGDVDKDAIACHVHSPRGDIPAGLHPATGGDGSLACSADMLLEALVGCAGVTFKAVATALVIPVRSATITAEADLDFRGTLGVSKDAPVGLTAIRLSFQVEADAPAEQIAKLVELTERYCVIYQTLKHSPTLSTMIRHSA